MNAALTIDGTRVVTDFGEYRLTGEEIGNEALALSNAKVKCAEARDSGWFYKRRWDEPLNAATDLKNFQDFK